MPEPTAHYLVSETSTFHPVALLFLVAMGLIMCFGQRPAAVKALLATAAFLPFGQQIVVFGLHFYFFRVLIVVGFCRLVMRGELQDLRLNLMDKLVIAWIMAGLVSGTLRNPAEFTGAACLGRAFNALGGYFLFRSLTRDPRELVQHLRFLALVAAGIGVAMLYEVMTRRNLFAVLGGVPEITDVREGRLRCQGPFRHPILTGTFAATLFPLMVGLRYQGPENKWRVILSCVGCVFSTIFAASSGALITWVTTCIGLALWPMRGRMQLVRRSLVVGAVVMAIVMNAPVWYLISRVSNIMGGTGWHRSYLIDQAVKHFNEWWLIGSSYTAHWAPSGQVLLIDPNNMDITNHYIVQGLRGGILGLLLFIACLAMCFKTVGRFVRGQPGDSPRQKLAWACGVSLAGHCTAFISISYFDQSEVFLYWLWAVIATVPVWQAGVEEREASPEPVESCNPRQQAMVLERVAPRERLR